MNKKGNPNLHNPNIKKGEMPAHLRGKGFDAHPEHIWKGGRPAHFGELRKLVQQMGNEEIQIELGTGKYKKNVRLTRFERILLDWFNSQSFDKQQAIMSHGFGKVPDRLQVENVSAGNNFTGIPADLLAPSFLEVYRDVKKRLHTEYLLFGGRGSTKSSFISLVIIELIITHPTIHALITRQVANTLRDSVYSQMLWAINELGLSDSFKGTTSPLQIEYIPTGQIIYFRGADDPGKMKSIKPPFGHIAILWFEELDQFHGQEAVRKIEQSAIRGGDEAWIFKSFNPPRTSGNWANKYVQIPKESQLQHKADYTTVPKEWLGQVFIDEAEHLKEVNPGAYDHEYLGEINGTGGQVFDNVTLRKITKEEIEQFDRVHEGIDWGFYPDPFAWVRCHYDANRHRLYIYNEYKANKKGNEAVYKELVKQKGISKQQLIIADNAEPKSVADFLAYGASIRSAEKGADSVSYSMKWLQSLAEIVIDNVRCPESAGEFIDYELEVDKDGEYISEYPDKNNHFIDATRYALNMLWRQRGQ
jgi:PBSX family phage terminase large subunit